MRARDARGSAEGGNGTADPAGSVPSAEESISDIIAEFSQVFAFARTRWTRYAEEIHPELRGVGMMVLQTIRRRGPITATELSRLLDMDKAVVSRQVAKLRQLDLIDAEPSAEDRRVVLLTTNAAAQSTIDGLHAQTAHAYHERFEGWNAEDLRELRTALRRFNRSARSGPEGPAMRCTRDQEPD